MLPHVVVVDLDVLHAGLAARVVDDGQCAGQIGEYTRRALLGKPRLTKEVVEKNGLRPCVTCRHELRHGSLARHHGDGVRLPRDSRTTHESNITALRPAVVDVACKRCDAHPL